MLQIYNKYGQLKVVSSTSSSGVSSVSGVSPITSTGGSNPIISTLVTPHKLLGRHSASTGPMQEITLGSGLSLTGTTLNVTNPVTPSALTKTNDTNVTLTLGGSPSVALLAGVSLTLGWTGTLADSRIASAATWNAKQNALNGTGFVKSTAGVISYDTTTYYPYPTGTVSQYIDGTGAFQTFPAIPTVGTWGALNYPTWTTGTPFVKMTAAGTFSLDTNTYLTGITSSDVTTALGYTPVTNARTITINGTIQDLSADRNWSVGTVTSVAAITLGTSGTDLSSSVATGTTTPVITLNVPDASATARGVITTGDQTLAGVKTFSSAPILNSLTASQLLALDGSKNIQTLSTSTYPNLTELSYVKDVTSAIQPQIDAVNVNVITLTTSVSIDTNTQSGVYGQHGRHVKISNGANAINIQCVSTSNADFVASYEKLGTSNITFTAGAGITLTTLSGTAILSGVAGSKACLSRTSGVYYLQITNY